MSRNVFIVLILLVVTAYFSYLLYQKRYLPKYDWTESYDIRSDQPYGLKYFYRLLDNYKKEEVELISYRQPELLLDTLAEEANYIYFPPYDEYLDSLKAEFFLNYAKKGNTVFLISSSAPLEVLRMLNILTDSVHDYISIDSSRATVCFAPGKVPYEGNFTFFNKYLKDTVKHDWCGYSQAYFNKTFPADEFIPISYLNTIQHDSLINLFYVNHGKGKLVFYANNNLLTNYHLATEEGFKNTNNLLSHLNSGKIYWDLFEEESEGIQPFNNPLKFLFSHRSLRWGWYLFVSGLLLYVLFRSKREQRIIPIVPANNNSTIEFAKTIGTLYFQKGKAKDIAEEMYLHFLADARSKYAINTNLAPQELMEKIQQQSGVEMKILKEIFNLFKLLPSHQQFTQKELVKLHNLLILYTKTKK